MQIVSLVKLQIKRARYILPAGRRGCPGEVNRRQAFSNPSIPHEANQVHPINQMRTPSLHYSQTSVPHCCGDQRRLLHPVGYSAWMPPGAYGGYPGGAMTVGGRRSPGQVGNNLTLPVYTQANLQLHHAEAHSIITHGGQTQLTKSPTNQITDPQLALHSACNLTQDYETLIVGEVSVCLLSP